MNLFPDISAKSVGNDRSFKAGLRWTDLAIFCGLAALAAILTYLRFQSIDPVLHTELTEDVWFGSDIERVIGNISERNKGFRAGVHPLFPLMIYPFVKGLTLTGIERIDAIQLVTAGATALWVGLMALIFRLVGCRPLDTLLYGTLLLFSAGIMFWTAVPESYLFGSLSLIVPLLVVAIARHYRLSQYWYVLASAVSLGITTTNWMAGILATFVTHRWQKTILLTGQALMLVMALWFVQSMLFSNADFFLASDVFQEELKYVAPQTSGGPLRVLFGLFFHPMVMPDIQVIPSNRGLADWPMLSAQLSNPGSGGPLGPIAVLLWTALLSIGIWALFSKNVSSELRLFLLLTMAGQLALHLIYGEETFLYALHVLPFLAVIVALGSLTRLRLATLCLASTLLFVVAVNNTAQFSEASAFLEGKGALRQVQMEVEVPADVPTSPLGQENYFPQ